MSLNEVKYVTVQVGEERLKRFGYQIGEIPNVELNMNYPSGRPPALIHSLHELGSSILSLASDEKYIYSGSQSQDILVWCKSTFKLSKTLKGHAGSVLALELAPDRRWLFSSSSDSTVWIWSTKTLQPIYVLHPFMETASGDLFALTWCSAHQSLYIGCQDTSLQWYRFDDDPQSSPRPGSLTPKRAHKFFDSQSRFVASDTPFGSPPEGQMPPQIVTSATTLHIPGTNIRYSAHYGYIYCMAILPVPRTSSTNLTHVHSYLVTGSGDETIKLWNCDTGKGPALAHTLQCHHGAVLALAVTSETIYAGCQDGHVNVWDVETKTLVRTIIAQEGVDILSLSLKNSTLYSCSANGVVQRWSSLNLTGAWAAHPHSIALSSIITRNAAKSKVQLITGGSDDHIHIWDIDTSGMQGESPIDNQPLYYMPGSAIVEEQSPSDTLTAALAKFVSFASVSSDPMCREDCRQAAIWLKTCLNQLGALSTLLPTSSHLNPLVLATFTGTESNKPKPRVLFYGHYDVIPASKRGWESDPFTLSGRNGYLYGRGASDNKGPILAAAFAAAELLKRRALGIDLVFLIEGEEECGSKGFMEAVQKYKEQIGSIDAVLVSNSTWITEDPPCITYGLRGVIHCSIEVKNDFPDLHSGIEGGAVPEPMIDMVRLLATLTDDRGKVQIPEFYDSLRPQQEDEKEWFIRLSALTQTPAANLEARWREPALTVHRISASGPQNSTVIPSSVKAQISLRIVPDQNLKAICASLSEYLRAQFAKFQSPNTLQVSIEHIADWWLGDVEDLWFKALENSIREEWDVEPLRIREGGSIPSIPYLEKEFGCHALQLPLGQSSDQGHLANERIGLTNLVRGKSVIERFLTAASEMQ